MDTIAFDSQNQFYTTNQKKRRIILFISFFIGSILAFIVAYAIWYNYVPTSTPNGRIAAKNEVAYQSEPHFGEFLGTIKITFNGDASTWIETSAYETIVIKEFDPNNKKSMDKLAYEYYTVYCRSHDLPKLKQSDFTYTMEFSDSDKIANLNPDDFLTRN